MLDLCLFHNGYCLAITMTGNVVLLHKPVIFVTHDLLHYIPVFIHSK